MIERVYILTKADACNSKRTNVVVCRTLKEAKARAVEAANHQIQRAASPAPVEAVTCRWTRKYGGSHWLQCEYEWDRDGRRYHSRFDDVFMIEVHRLSP